VTGRLQGLLLVLLAAGLLAGAVLADRAFTRFEREELTAMVQLELERVTSATEAVMRDFLQLSRGLAAAVIADPDLDQAAFERIARELFQEYPEVRNVAAAPGLVIRYVYPTEGNEPTLGLDYRTVPEQYRVVARARDTRQAIVDGPVALVQGGTGFIMRNPVFLRRGNGEPEFWGLVASVLDADDLFRRIGLDDPDLPVEVAIRRVADGDEALRHIFGDAGLFVPENIETFVHIQGYTWQFAAAPAAGWSVDPVRQSVFRAILALIVIFILLPAGALVHAQRRVRSANANLDATLTAIPQTLFEVDRSGGIRAVWADPNGLLAGHGDSVASVLPEDVTAVLLRAVASTHAGSPATTRHVCIPQDDTTRWFEMSVAPKAVDESFLVLMHDRTERWLSEQQERIRHAVLEKLGQGSPVGDMLEFIMRQVPARKSGLQCAVVIDGKAVATSDMTGPVVAELTVLVGNGERQRRIVSALSPGLAGSGVEQVLVEPVLGADAALLASVVFTTTDADIDWRQLDGLVEFIAQMVTLTIERARLNESLAIAESVYRGSSEGMMLVDSEERIIAVNPAFTAITGYSESEVIGLDQKLLRSPRYGEEIYREIRLALARTGSWSGELWGRNKDGHDFPSWITVNWVEGGATGGPHTIALFSDISEKKKADELIWAQANYDALTQLPNRRLFVDRLEQGLRKAARDHTLLALLMVDLDGFKEVNDTLGHHFGDQLLVEAARRISSCVRASDSVSRLGGDEFTVMMTDLRSSADVDRVTQKVLDILAEPFHIESHPVYISGSIGITLFPDDAETFGRHDEERRPGDVRIEAAGSQPLYMVLPLDAGGGPVEDAAGSRPARGHRTGTVPCGLPAGRVPRHRSRRQGRGAGPLGASRTRRHQPGHFHPGGRRDGHDRRHRPHGVP
jgi:diguanylate cyclase (GGDEF)-like protein/PAS domain S-box-containing protein